MCVDGILKTKKGRYIMENWMTALVRQVLTLVSPNIKKALVDFVKKLEADAKATPNPWDDIAVGLLEFILDIK